MLRSQWMPLILFVGLVLIGTVGVISILDYDSDRPEPVAPVANGDISQLSKARTIYIENDWTGLFVPFQSHYDLTRQIDSFEGTVTHTVGSGLYLRQAVENVSVPLTVAQDFLLLLAQSPAVIGKYQPFEGWTDSYPSLVIEALSEDRAVRFYSESQGEDRVPWGLDQLGESYTINSNQPAKALALLKPYLKEDVLDRLRHPPTSTP